MFARHLGRTTDDLILYLIERYTTDYTNPKFPQAI
jgi:hypothetical protein